jgi:hypothetical protein
VLTPADKALQRDVINPLRRDLLAWAAEAVVGPKPAAPMAERPGPSYLIGLDLGQAQDYSALCVVERTQAPRAEDQDAGPVPLEREVHRYGVRHLYRWKLGTPYSAIVADVATLTGRPPLPGSSLVIDNTGVGRPVVEMFRAAKLPVKLVPVTITGGNEAARGPGGWSVPKKDLVAAMQTLVQYRRFHVAPSLPDAVTLGRELQQFRVKVTAAGNETFEAWRERDHDDMVLAVALACWYGARRQRSLSVW